MLEGRESGGLESKGADIPAGSSSFSILLSSRATLLTGGSGPVDVNYFYIVGTIGNPLSAVATSNP